MLLLLDGRMVFFFFVLQHSMHRRVGLSFLSILNFDTVCENECEEREKKHTHTLHTVHTRCLLNALSMVGMMLMLLLEK